MSCTQVASLCLRCLRGFRDAAFLEARGGEEEFWAQGSPGTLFTVLGVIGLWVKTNGIPFWGFSVHRPFLVYFSGD